MTAACPLPSFAPLNVVEALVDGTLVKRVAENDYIGRQSMSLTFSGLPLAPGDHALRLTVTRQGYQQTASVSPLPIRADPGPIFTLSDADTGEALMTLQLPAQEIVMLEHGEYSWSLAVPIFDR
jgi:hypothetical protein